MSDDFVPGSDPVDAASVGAGDAQTGEKPPVLEIRSLAKRFGRVTA